MATCVRCGCEFNVSSARRSIGRRFYAGAYDDNFPDEDVCTDCATEELDGAVSTWNEMRNLPGDWDDD